MPFSCAKFELRRVRLLLLLQEGMRRTSTQPQLQLSLQRAWKANLRTLAARAGKGALPTRQLANVGRRPAGPAGA
jgi:hypothetical protein